ncbi:GNAT family N-acetyltransferase [Rhizobium sullae]|uniref:GNAT family N-acetyltransferase n=1 Tax=Rhizobium sullae TaxID=50338 RepID=A0ABY5XPF9_RHISU|nr:GNAT family N-acetyltransferase [Rhizobium sullae]UWU16059.1 GNAT family N-acetyltransferase [Rhizobium sullae]
MLRLGSTADIEIVKSLTGEAYARYLALLGAEPIPVTDDDAPRIARGEIWLFEINGVCAGLAVLERHKNHAMLISIAVSPAHQGRRHGSTILRWVEAKAQEWQLPELRLHTNARTMRNIAIYKGFGFQGRRPSPYRPGSTIVDMTKAMA